jgi:hypothetical protein
MDAPLFQDPRFYFALIAFVLIASATELLMRYFKLNLPPAKSWREWFLRNYGIYPKSMDRAVIRRYWLTWFVAFIVMVVTTYFIFSR